MWQSHFSAPVWKSVIADTVEIKPMDYTAERLGISHQTVLTMRHKILMAMAEAPGFNDNVLGSVTRRSFLNAKKGANSPVTHPESPAGMAQRRQKGAFQMSTCASAQGWNATAELMRCQPTGQSRTHWSFPLSSGTISARRRLCCATGWPVITRSLPWPGARSKTACILTKGRRVFLTLTQ